MKKLLLGIMCIIFVYTSANAKEGNNSRIQNLEAQVAELQNQINEQNVAAGSASEASEVVFELCNLFVLTDNTPPIFCRDCGNSNLELIEQCDDGNAVSGDGCSADCLWEECGNGIVDPNEECDDGNVSDGDGCSSSCAKENKIVFLTSKAYSGNLGGLDGADTICNDLALDAGLPGTFKAWLSDSVISVSERFIHAGPYILVDGTIIAEDWIELTDGYLSHPINRDENNNSYGNQRVWTNTQWNGEIKGYSENNNCKNWTTSSGTYGVYGSSFSTYFWTDNSIINCSYSGRLYCFEQ